MDEAFPPSEAMPLSVIEQHSIVETLSLNEMIIQREELVIS